MIPHKEGMTLFELMVFRVLESMIEKPNSGLLNEVLDRLEGKVIYPLQISHFDEIDIDALNKLTTEELREIARLGSKNSKS